MSLLVQYNLKEGQADAQREALIVFIDGLKALGNAGFNYTAFSTGDPTKFIALLEFDDEDTKQRFLDSAPFATYREGAKMRFTGPPETTEIALVASTRG